MGAGRAKREHPSRLRPRPPANVSSARMKRQGTAVRAPTGLAAVEVDRIVSSVRDLTMVPEPGLRFTVETTVDAINREIPGAVVECGVWRGGCSIAMLEAQRAVFGGVVRPVYMLDSFEGLPPATSRDGPLAAAWQASVDAPDFYDNCKASEAELRSNLDKLRFTRSDYRIVAGWFVETLPTVAAELRNQGIAVLRLDADWYEPTLLCLEHLVPLVAEDGFVLLDDYYAWDGCARAMHDYVARRNVPYRIRSVADFAGAYFINNPFRDTVDAL
jgi:O-methyltransferase